MNKIRTRFAPSPTGWLHIGGLRTALFAYLIAKKEDGDFLLRIEDTDKDRTIEGAIDFIYKALKIAKLQHDEGPDIGGNYGPYVQSERAKTGLYLKYAEQLVESGHAFYCFCKKQDYEENNDEIDDKDQKFIKQNDPCKHISLEEAKKKIASGEQYVIKQIIPSGNTTFEDSVFGKITVDNKTLDEQILIKSDGFPTYNFANVIDDHLMEITHVVRGSEYLSSTPKYNLLYQAFGWIPPIYVHVPQIMKDKTHKLSKRNGDASFQDLISKGFLPDAILNYITLLGWHPSDDREIFSIEDLKKEFSIDRIAKSDAIFDPEKLRWMNGVYIRNLSDSEFHKNALHFYSKVITKSLNLNEISKLLKERIETFAEIPEMIDFFEVLPEYSTDLYIHKKMKTTTEIAKIVLPVVKNKLELLENWEPDSLKQVFMDTVSELNLKNGQVFYPVRIALSGKEFTPGGPVEIANILGKDETLTRLEDGIKRLKIIE